jgi:hypothetical protein
VYKISCLQIDNHINWKSHIDKLILKLSGACCAVTSVVHISNINTLKSIYYVYFPSIIKYGIILRGNYSNSGKIFTLQKKIIRNMAGAQPRTTCRRPFKQFRDYTWSMPVYTFIYELHYQ